MSLERVTSQYDDSLSERFLMSGVPYTSQYFTLSMQKLETLKPCFRPLIEQRWPDTAFKCGLNDANREEYVYVDSIKDAKKQSVIVGMLYKEMKLRPSPLAEYASVVHVKQQILPKYISEDDRLFIEDETVRMPIRDCKVLNPQLMVTGVIVCLKGVINDQGEFETEEYMLPGQYLTIPFVPAAEEKYVAFVSGLQIAEANVDHSALMLLKDFILGNTPLNDLSRKITRLIVAGNGVGNCDIQSLVECDVYLSQLASCVYIDVMPGDADPSNRNIPQQPIIPCFFEHSKRYGTFKSVTNPYFFSVDGIRFLGTSGQSVKGVCDYSMLSEIDALKLSVMSRLIAPTAPDTLGCHPEAKGLTLEKNEEFPHIVFSGNCSEYAFSALGNGGEPPVALCVPKFRTLPSIVLVSLSTLKAKLIKLC